jgi:DNA replication protein DnaC
MLYQQTIEKLHALKLTGFANALEEQRRSQSAADLTFEERLGLLVERQWLWRENRSLKTRLRQARLKVQACVEDLDYRASRGLGRDVLEQMAAAEWVANRRCCLITGPAGAGKTYLACALAQRACRDGFRTIYYQAQKLFRELATARCDGSLSRLLAKITRAHLLVIDDLGLEKAGPDDYRDLLELIDDRHGTGATIMTSQYPVSAWHDLIGNATVADALLDRLVHGAYRIDFTGSESMRKIRATREAGAANRKPTSG